ncbi:MAG TPA: hypothetical protein VNA19_00080 [Pyrinomonadaceae bacterium]|nr:hypothetical protein [Pyrinomonadaceae bacterium]
MVLPLDVEAVSSSRSYTVANRLLSIHASDARTAQLAESFFGAFYLTPYAARVPDRVDCHINLWTDMPPSVPPHLQLFEMPRGVCYTDGETYFLDVDESRFIVGPPAARQIDVWFGETAHARHPVALINVMSYVMHMALRRCALYDLHAAGVVEPSTGAGVLFVGESNSGKSSLTVRLTRSGWSYLSDDMLLLFERQGSVEARALRRLFAVSAATLDGCQLPRLDEALGTPVNSDPSKRRLEPSIVFPESFAEQCTPRVICFPVVTGERESRLEPLRQADVLTQLIRLCVWTSFDATARDYLRFLGRLVRQTKAYRLLAGLDLLEDPARASALLTPHVAAAAAAVAA